MGSFDFSATGATQEGSVRYALKQKIQKMRRATRKTDPRTMPAVELAELTSSWADTEETDARVTNATSA
jgi:hypothetical protein